MTSTVKNRTEDGVHTAEGTSAGPLAALLSKQRERERVDYELRRKAIAGAGPRRVGGRCGAAAAALGTAARYRGLRGARNSLYGLQVCGPVV